MEWSYLDLLGLSTASFPAYLSSHYYVINIENKHNMDLIPRARNFDLAALESIYDQYHQGLTLYACRLIGNSGLAEECVADTFSKFLKALREGRGPDSNIKGYLYRSAHNWITDYYRKHREEKELDEDIPASEQEEIGKAVERKMERQRLRKVLSQLPREQYQVVALHLIQGWDLAEVAESMDRTVGAVKSLQHRALVNMRKILNGQE